MAMRPGGNHVSGPVVRNAVLARFLEDAGFADRRSAFARLINIRGKDYGAEFKYTHTAVKRWIAGSVPHPPAPDVITDALTRLLGSPVTPADIGWPPSGSDIRGLVADLAPVHTLSTVAALTGRKMNRRDLLRRVGAVSAAAFSDAALLSLTHAFALVGAAVGGGRQIGAVDV